VSTTGGWISHQSNLLASVFPALEEERPLSIFDADAANSVSFEYFSNNPCRLRFTDLYREVGADSTGRDERLRAALSFPPGTHFDVCLFWDVLNFMSGDDLKTFAIALQPYVSSATRGHAFCAFASKMSLVYRQYAVTATDSFVSRVGSLSNLQVHPHRQREILAAIPYLYIEHATLRRDGRSELLCGFRE
jgi:hypothetical protein|tara:strand:- start:1924 stop:2496 length:573 start_codon:yes stop_codon:yes gene_type:complete